MTDQNDVFQLQRIGHRGDIVAKIGHRPVLAIDSRVAVPGEVNGNHLMRGGKDGQLR